MPKEMLSCDTSGTLLTRVRELCKAHPSLTQLSEETGLPYFWLNKVVKGETTSPNVNRIQFLYEHLTGHSLLEAY